MAILSTPDLDGPVGSVATLGTDSSQRPDVGDTAGSEHVHGLFSFDIGTIPAGAEIVSATMELTSIGTTGNPAQMMGGAMAIDHLRYANTFPTVLNDIVFIIQSGIALWDDIPALGARTIDVTNRVKIDRLAGRSRSQFRIRGLVSTDGDNQTDLVTFAGGEDQNGDAPILTVLFETP